MEIEDTDRISFFISQIVNHFYRKNYLTAYKYGLDAIQENTILVCEESQNLFDSSVISKKVFNRLRKMFSETRNLKIHFVMATQRLQDLNTKIRGRTRYLIGQPNIDDYSLKIEKLLKNSAYRKDILNLEVGQFLYTPTDTLVKFSKFQQVGKPYNLETPKICCEKRLSLFQRIKERFIQ